MKKTRLFQFVLLVFCLVLSSFSFSQFRIIGYVLGSEYSIPDFKKLKFDKLTHLNIAFVNPDSAGNLIIPMAFDSLVQVAHQHEVKVLVSIGGGGRVNPYYAGLLRDTNRKSFVNKLVQFANEHQLEGIDVDLEGEVIDENYEAFILDTKRKMFKY